MKKIITITSIFFFFLGVLFSGFLTMYFKVEEYKEDIFIADGNKSGRTGALLKCSVLGSLKSNGRRTAISCELFRKYFPKLKIGDLPFGRPKPGDTITYEVPVFVSPQGGLSIFNEEEKRFEPGVKPLPFWSFPTYFMMPLPLLLLFYFFRFVFKRMGFLALGVFLTFSFSSLNAQDTPSSEFMSFNVRTIISKEVTVEVVQYDSLDIKKTDFDTVFYALKYPEECLTGAT